VRSKVGDLVVGILVSLGDTPRGTLDSFWLDDDDVLRNRVNA
jgi:hypothetical protein